MRIQFLQGDCVTRMAMLPGDSVGGIICDPPYGLEFLNATWDKLKLDGVGRGGANFSSDGMGKGFKSLPSFTGSPNPLCRNCKGSLRGRDRVGFRVCRCDNRTFPNVGKVQGERMADWHIAWLTEAYRVLVPGGQVKAFGGSRTYHRLAAAMVRVGFSDVRLEAWAYSSGFPKGLDVSKAIDRGRRDETEHVARFLVDALQASGVSRTKVAAAVGGSKRLIDWWIPSAKDLWTARIPIMRHWWVLKEVLGFDDSMDAEVQRLNDRKGHVGEAWHARPKVGVCTEGTTTVVGLGTKPSMHQVFDLTESATEQSRLWQGWGTALKPAWEPIVVGTKSVACGQNSDTREDRS